MILISKYLLQMQNNIIYKYIKRVCCIIFLSHLVIKNNVIYYLNLFLRDLFIFQINIKYIKIIKTFLNRHLMC